MKNNNHFIQFTHFSVISLAFFSLLLFFNLPTTFGKELDSFQDLSKSHWAYDNIMEMKDKGIINGYPDGTFKPSNPISREHVASLFVRSLDLTPVRAGKEFKDVPKTHPYYDDIQAVYRAGIFDGNPDGTFGAKNNLTRAQMSKVIVNAFNLAMVEGYIFDDVFEDHWAKDYIATLYVNGITTGDDGKYKPSDSVTRAQYAAFLYRALNPDKVEKPTEDLKPTPPTKPKPEPKPEPQPQPEPKPDVPDTNFETETGYKYENYEPKDVPKPKGYVAGEHEKKRQAEAYEILKQNGHGFVNGLSSVESRWELYNRGIFKETPKEYFEYYATEVLGITYDELIDILNWTVDTGKLYNGGSFTIYADFQTNGWMVTGDRIWEKK